MDYPAPHSKEYINSHLDFINIYTGYYPLSEKLSLVSQTSSTNYLSLGSINLIEVGINARPFDWITLTNSGFLTKYALYGGHYHDYGYKSNIRFNIEDD